MMNQLNPVPGKRKKKKGAPADMPQQKIRKGKKAGKILSDDRVQKKVRKGNKVNKLIDTPQAKRRKPKNQRPADPLLPTPRPEQPRKLPKGKGSNLLVETGTNPSFGTLTLVGDKGKVRKRKPVLYSKGGMMNKKGYAKGGMMKKKGYAKGGKVMTYNVGGMVKSTGTLNTGVKKA
jgi:hypothetical protein